jgi:mRNA-degrading endonuclease RelE of RelBE toxin-antitoxin system
MAANKYQVLVDSKADRKLAAHIEFLARVSKNAAIRLYIEYEKSLEFLKDSPTNCPPYLPIKPIDAKLKYKLFGKRYRIVFEIIDNVVYVYDIQDCRQDNDKNFI